MKVLILKVHWCKCGNSEHPHKYIKKPELHGKNGIKTNVYDIDEPFCCIEMAKALDENFVSFGNPAYSMTKDSFFCISNNSWGADIMKIDSCPFCGEKINYVDGGDYKGD